MNQNRYDTSRLFISKNKFLEAGYATSQQSMQWQYNGNQGGMAYLLEEDQETTHENNLLRFSICHMIATKFPEGYLIELLESHISDFWGKIRLANRDTRVFVL